MACRERTRQALEALAFKRLESGKTVEAELQAWVYFRMHKRGERTERAEKRLEAARGRLEEQRQQEHAQEAPSGLLRLVGRLE